MVKDVTNTESIPSSGASLADRRFDYQQGGLVENEALGDPFTQFEIWMADAIVACEGTAEEPHAMSLATVGPDTRPSVRTVLLKGFDRRGFVWFTNYESRKGTEITEYVAAAVNFRWGVLERQVSARGLVARVDVEESDAVLCYSSPRKSDRSNCLSPIKSYCIARAARSGSGSVGVRAGERNCASGTLGWVPIGSR